MILFLNKLFFCATFLFSSACGNQPMGQQSSDGGGDITFEESKNQNLNCASKVVPNHVVSPDFKKVQKKAGVLQLGKKIIWEADPAILRKYKASFAAVERETNRTESSQGNDVVIQLKIVSSSALQKLENIPSEFNDKGGGYLLQIKPDRINIFALEEAGFINALGSLESMIDLQNGKLNYVSIVDWPDLEMRGAQIVFRAITPEVAFAAIDRLRRGHYNLVLFSVSNNVQFKSIGRLANNCAWPLQDFKKVVQYARESGMEVVPELRFLSHQHKDFLVLGAYPDLMYNEKTYDPRNQKVYKLVFSYIDEVIETINPKAIHIGHDEVYGISGRDAGAEDALPPALFKEDVVKLHQYLKARNVLTWMWGDMLITPTEFPDMHPGSINGTREYAQIRKEIPKDIVICDWHYRADENKELQFPSLKTFANEGFEVLGATFRHPHVTKQFAGYAADVDNPKVKGMIATTWTFLRKGAQNGRKSDNYKSFDNLVQYSAEVFWNGDSYQSELD